MLASSDSGSHLLSWAPLLGLVVILSAFGLVLWLEHRRARRIQAFAASRGMGYTSRNDGWARLDLGYPHGIGDSHKARHVLTGVHHGRPIAVFEHQWSTGSGKQRSSHSARVTVMGLPRAFPRVEVRTEGLLSRAARRLGVRDIELESESFNDEYRISGDRRFAYDVLNPPFMQWMLDNAAGGFCINGPHIAVTVDGRIDLRYVDGEIAYLDAIVSRLPRYLVEG
ncbi:hypothetical protein [Cumulibacter manganitolerans]|uniref:hypothetical protein n=1 Tax=Cumulibacter manganitolerans TaxID=1884992 RepID=UPI001885EBD8|nr:hypothetical protein [Cumulibacter manganitolerans]